MRAATSRRNSSPTACSRPTSGASAASALERGAASRSIPRCSRRSSASLLDAARTRCSRSWCSAAASGYAAACCTLMSMLPIITPPFVIGLALILLFGRTGIVTGWLDGAFGIPPLALDLRPARRHARAAAHVHADRLHDAATASLGAISPSLEEAAQTLRATRCAHVPHRHLAAAAARRSPTRSCSASSRASPISAIRSCSAATSRCCRRRSSSRSSARNTTRAAPRCSRSCCSRSRCSPSGSSSAGSARLVYVTVTGKGDARPAAPLPRRAVADLLRDRRCRGSRSRSSCYAVILIGGFVSDIGPRRHDAHVSRISAAGFAVDWGPRGLFFTGSAWNSLFSTIEVAAIAAPLTALRRPARPRTCSRASASPAGGPSSS